MITRAMLITWVICGGSSAQLRTKALRARYYGWSGTNLFVTVGWLWSSNLEVWKIWHWLHHSGSSHYTAHVAIAMALDRATLLITWKVCSQSWNCSRLEWMHNCRAWDCSHSGSTLANLPKFTELVGNIDGSTSWLLNVFEFMLLRVYPLSFLVDLGSCFRPHMQVVVNLVLSKWLVYFGSLFVDLAVVYVLMVHWRVVAAYVLPVMRHLVDFSCEGRLCLELLKLAQLLNSISELCSQNSLHVFSIRIMLELTHEFYVLERVDLQFGQLIVEASFTYPHRLT